MDSDHSSASHLDMMDSDLEHPGTVMESSSTVDSLLRLLLLLLQDFVAAPVGEG